MKFGKNLSLRVQLILAMAGCVLLAVAFGYGGLNLFGEYQVTRVKAELSPQALSAITKLEKNQLPSTDEMKELLATDDKIGQTILDQQDFALLVLSIVAMLVGGAAAMFLANRIAAPLDGVATALRYLAAGDLSVRAISRSPGSAEASKLITDFNIMADALQRYDRELTEGAAAIAHELRTPLTILRGRLQGMKDHVFEPSEKEISGLILQVEALSRIVDDLQTVSFAEVGILTLHRGPIDLAKVVGELSHFVAPEIKDAGMRLNLSLTPAPVFADPFRVRQAALALITNACRHARSGGVIDIDCGLVGDFGIIRVMDRGPGLSSLAVENVFRLFWREDPSRARDYGGSGIGLSVVEAIASAHGGSITASHRAGGGAQFELRIPQKPATPAPIVHKGSTQAP
ncbi:MAG: ATP-binding protein [Hyphomonadaceae bacterium]|jgi:signal transduction histidine kinase|uniref:ATP-binding protein n=1 Tax=Aquidulcibacter sp. TaxID=2052990 RepID=UPI0022C79471|nr:ATP-binding protein [Aquidulcibacter sp.]MCE2891013.1 ATP-binding protein [Hyphomonadaceae bacterium]MCZ8207267.1 ATP-binding protein [Aquidulcibacter sp.]